MTAKEGIVHVGIAYSFASFSGVGRALPFEPAKQADFLAGEAVHRQHALELLEGSWLLASNTFGCCSYEDAPESWFEGIGEEAQSQVVSRSRA
jgi:hypothetical protein